MQQQAVRMALQSCSLMTPCKEFLFAAIRHGCLPVGVRQFANIVLQKEEILCLIVNSGVLEAGMPIQLGCAVFIWPGGIRAVKVLD